MTAYEVEGRLRVGAKGKGDGMECAAILFGSAAQTAICVVEERSKLAETLVSIHVSLDFQTDMG